jgi:CRP-like cAMP-binding protein
VNGAIVVHCKVAAMPEADHRQADYFREELGRQIELLDEQVQKIRAALERAEQRGDRPEVHRSQHELHVTAREHAKIRQMLAALDRRFAGGPAKTTR